MQRELMALTRAARGGERAREPDRGASGRTLPLRERILAAEINVPDARQPAARERSSSASTRTSRSRRWWYAPGVNAQRLGMSDHSWVHIQIVTNIALRLARLLFQRGVEPAMVTDHGHDRARRRGRDRGGRDAPLPRAWRSTARTTSASRCSSPPTSCRRCSRASTRSPSARSSRPRRCTRSSATARRGSRSRSRARSSASRTRSTWPRAARGCRSRRGRRTSTRCRPTRSSEVGSPPGERDRGARRDRDVEQRRDLPGRRGPRHEAPRHAARAAHRGRRPHRGRAREAPRAGLPAVARRRRGTERQARGDARGASVGACPREPSRRPAWRIVCPRATRPATSLHVAPTYTGAWRIVCEESTRSAASSSTGTWRNSPVASAASSDGHSCWSSASVGTPSAG